MRKKSRRGLAFAALASLTIAAPANAQAPVAAPAPAPTLDVVGGDTSRTVQLVPCRRREATPEAQGVASGECTSGEQRLVGTLTLVVENTTGAGAQVAVHYVQNGASGPAPVTGGSVLTLVGARADGLPARLRALAGGMRPLDTARLLLAIGSRGAPAGREAVTVDRIAPGLRTAADAARGGSQPTGAQLDQVARGLTALLRQPGATLALATADAGRLLGEVATALKAAPAARAVPVAALASDVVRTLGSNTTLPVPKHGSRVLALRFDAPTSTNAAALGGVLVLDGTAEDEPIPHYVPVKTEVGALAGVTFGPSKIQLDSSWPWDGASQSIDLWGSGVGTLFASGAPKQLMVRLEGPGGHRATAVLNGFARAGDDPLHATATVTLSGDPLPGKYTGALPLSRVQGAEPHLDLEVHSSIPWWGALAVIVIGLLLGGLFPRIAALRQRRTLLLHALSDAIDNYRLHTESESRSPTAWTLGDLVADEQVASMEADIRSARNDADVDDETARVLDVVARVQRWLRLEPAARRLKRLVEQTAPPALNCNRWVDSKTYRDTRLVLRDVKREPGDVPAADALAAEVLWQIDWYHKLAYVWTGAPSFGDAAAVRHLDASLAAKAPGDRNSDDRDTLDEALDDLISGRVNCHVPEAGSLEDLETKADDGLKRDDDARPEPMWKVDPQRFTGWATLDGLALGRLRRQARRGLLSATSYKRIADAALTPAATRGSEQSGKVDAAAIAKAATAGDPPTAGSPAGPSADTGSDEDDAKTRPPPIRFARWIARGLQALVRYARARFFGYSASELFWSLLLVLGASVAYLDTIYNDTWGSLVDVLTAIGAGFGTAVAVQWAALPIFRSRRLRVAAADAATKTATAAKV